MSEYDYTGNKIQNCFTAYLQKCIRWKRCNYIKDKEYINDMEKPLEEYVQIEYSMTVEEVAEIYCREKILIGELGEKYVDWDDLSDQKLVSSLKKLRDDEIKFIYQHVFEKKSFKQIAFINGLSEGRIKNIYYYAIKKIRRWMRGDK